MADELPTARARTRRTSRWHSRLACPAHRVSYQVSVYADHGDDTRALLHTEPCRGEPEARNFAYNYLMSTYLELGFPNPGWQRLMVWCELEPGRWVGGQWQPDPRAEEEADIASLDPMSGRITIEPWASLRRWPPAAGGARWSDTEGAA